MAIEAGVSTYVVAGLSANRIKPVLDSAVARFHLMHKMRAELVETRRALEELILPGGRNKGFRGTRAAGSAERQQWKAVLSFPPGQREQPVEQRGRDGVGVRCFGGQPEGRGHQLAAP